MVLEINSSRLTLAAKLWNQNQVIVRNRFVVPLRMMMENLIV
jgi:hypothetical protein